LKPPARGPQARPPLKPRRRRRAAARRLREGRAGQPLPREDFALVARGGNAQGKESPWRAGGAGNRKSGQCQLWGSSLACGAAGARASLAFAAFEIWALASFFLFPPPWPMVPGGPAGGPPGARRPSAEGRGVRAGAREGRGSAASRGRDDSPSWAQETLRKGARGARRRRPRAAPGGYQQGLAAARASREQSAAGAEQWAATFSYFSPV